MEYNYISKVDPKKNPIKHIRFPKLTLSKQTIYEKQTTESEPINKKQQTDIHKKVMPPPPPPRPPPSKVIQSSKVIQPSIKVRPTPKTILECNESTIESSNNINKNVQRQNILLSSSSSSSASSSSVKQSDNRHQTTASETVKTNSVPILSQILHLSDSDETNCSSISSDENNQPNQKLVNVNVHHQQPLSNPISDAKSEELFSNISTSNSRTTFEFPLTQKHQNRISNLSEQIASLDLDDHSPSTDERIDDDDDHRTDKTVKHINNNNILQMKSTELNYSAETISSRDTSSNNDTDLTRSPLASSDLMDIIEITDDDGDDDDDDRRKRQHDGQPANIINSRNVLENHEMDENDRDTIRSSQMLRINNFFDNIPSGNSLIDHHHQRYSIQSDRIRQKTITIGTTTTTTTTTRKTINRQTITLANESLIDDGSADEQQQQQQENSSIHNVSETTLEDDDNDDDCDDDNNAADNVNITNDNDDDDEDVNNNENAQSLDNSNENAEEIQSQEIVPSQNVQQSKSKPITFTKRIETDCNNLSLGKIRIKAKFNINIEIHDNNSSSTNDESSSSSSGVSSSSPSTSSSSSSSSSSDNNNKNDNSKKTTVKKPTTVKKQLPSKNAPVASTTKPQPSTSASTNKKTKTQQQQQHQKLTKNINSKMLINDFESSSPPPFPQNLQQTNFNNNNNNNFDCPTLIANQNNETRMPLKLPLNLTKLLPMQSPPPPPASELLLQYPIPSSRPHLENKYLTKVKNVPAQQQQQQQGDFCKTPKNKRNPTTTTTSESIQIINEDDELLLNEIYGTSWQTPELLNKCTSHKKCEIKPIMYADDDDDVTESESINNNLNNVSSHKTVDESDDLVTNLTKPDKIRPITNPRISEGFLHFRRNIAIDFDSTRIFPVEDPKKMNKENSRKLLDTVTKRKKSKPIIIGNHRKDADDADDADADDDENQTKQSNSEVEKSINEIIKSPFFQKPMNPKENGIKIHNGQNVKKKERLNDEIIQLKRYNTRQCRKKVQYTFSESNSDNLDTNSNTDNKSKNNDDDNDDEKDSGNNEDVDNIFCDDDDDDEDCDNDNDDDDDDDDDWKIDQSHSSDSDEFELNDENNKNPLQTNRKTMKKSKSKKKNKKDLYGNDDDDDNRIIYLDLTKAEVTEVSESELNDLSKNVDPFKTPYAITTVIKPMTTAITTTATATATTEPRTKRKLFTPNYDNLPLFDNDDNNNSNNNNNNNNTVNDNEKRKEFEFNSNKKITNVKLTCPIPEFLLKPSDKIKNAPPETIQIKSIPKSTTTTKTTPKVTAPQKTISAPKTTITIPSTPTPTKTPIAVKKINNDVDVPNTNDKKTIKKGQKVIPEKIIDSGGGAATKSKFIPNVFTDDLSTKNSYGFLQSLDVTTTKELCHPIALQFRNDYKNRKLELTLILYELYNDRIFDGKLDVPITWNKKLLNTAGRCFNTRKKGIRSCRIELSEKVLTSADRLRCTLIHELCHAATWLFNGENGHGTTWKNWTYKAVKIFPELPKIGISHSYDIEYKYTYKCTKCDTKSYAHSKSKKVENIRCALCHNAIEIFLNKKTKEGKQICTPVRKASGFAAFVKEKYQQYKKPEFTHANVMKQLGLAFGSLSVEQKKKY